MCVCVCERERERERVHISAYECFFFSVVFVAHFDALMTGVGGSHIKHCGFPTQIQMQCVFHGGFEQNQN